MTDELSPKADDDGPEKAPEAVSEKEPDKRKTSKKKAAKKKTSKRKASKKKSARKKSARKKVTRKSVDAKAQSKNAPKVYGTNDQKALLAAFQKAASSEVAEVQRLAETPPPAWVSTGSYALDRALTPPGEKAGGIPCGRVIEVYAEEHVGKSTLADTIMCEFQKAGGVAILVETDANRDLSYTKKIGVDPEKVMHFSFKSGEQNLENVSQKIEDTIKFFKEKSPDVPVVIVLDALGATSTKSELDSGKKDKPGEAAKIIRKAARNWGGYIKNTQVTLVILNHTYESMNIFGGKKAYGGKGIPYAATLRLFLHRTKGGRITDAKGAPLGNHVGYKIEKWKLGRVGGTGIMTIISGYGVSNVPEIYEYLLKRGVIVGNTRVQGINIDGEVLSFRGWLGLQKLCEESPALRSNLDLIYRRTLADEYNKAG